MTQAVSAEYAHSLALVAFGANVAVHGQTLSEAIGTAIRNIDSPTCRLLCQSRMYRTPCFPVGAGPDYVNAVAAFRTTLSAHSLLDVMHRVEAELGRRRVQRWGSRTIDIDLLALDDAVLPDRATFWHWHDMAPDQQALHTPDTLILPHPRLSERAFVLVPLLDIAPHWRHPVLGQSVAQMARALPASDKAAVRPVAA